MNSYRNIPLWENTRRLRVLEEFGNDVVKYIDNSKYEWMLEGRTENSDAMQARPRGAETWFESLCAGHFLLQNLADKALVRYATDCCLCFDCLE